MNDGPNESFFARWTRRKAEQASAAGRGSAAPVAAPATGQGAPLPVPLPVPPTLADVASLVADADYSGFMAAGLDRAVHRAAMKKLFAEPHFNLMDGLDIYISDYTIASPVSPAMLAGLAHARSTLDPKPAWRTEEAAPAPGAVATDGAPSPALQADLADGKQEADTLQDAAPVDADPPEAYLADAQSPAAHLPQADAGGPATAGGAAPAQSPLGVPDNAEGAPA